MMYEKKECKYCNEIFLTSDERIICYKCSEETNIMMVNITSNGTMLIKDSLDQKFIFLPHETAQIITECYRHVQKKERYEK